MATNAIVGYGKVGFDGIEFKMILWGILYII
jgi:hypothetical protein